MPPTLETERLLLRPFTTQDSKAACAVLESDPDVWRYDPGYQRSPAQRAAIIEHYAQTNREHGCGNLAAIRKDSRQLIGYIGLQRYSLPLLPVATEEVELFYKLGRPHWGQGFALEGCRRLLEFAFHDLRLRRIVTVTHQDNTRSLRLLNRLGMRIEPGPPAWDAHVLGILENRDGGENEAGPKE